MRFESARDLFESAREADRDNARIRRMRETMEAREGPRRASLEPHGRNGGNADPMRATDSRMDKEAAFERRERENCRLIDLASALVYGEWYDGRGGIDALLGTLYADALYWDYLAGTNLAGAAHALGISTSYVRILCAVAFDALDAYGLQRAIEGTGIATD